MKQIHVLEGALALIVTYIMQIPAVTWLDLTAKVVTVSITGIVGVFAILHYIESRRANRTRRELDQMQIDKLKKEL
jgi:hypothetical protein